uniref:Phosphatidylethanolamine-binding protein n=1 Tax=Chrysotila carterae TaxID=13221 RepID=A0A7S4C472_CHRCT|mmetsp:Transcript_26856/g.59015  ORF Transcript_26856/g.59015 Transcript_26856/m.59015 type:complete len:215 (-) Transcript_26856:285-929(-)
MRELAVIAIILSGISSEESCSADKAITNPLADAERFVVPLGFPPGMPLLNVKFGKEGSRIVLNGSTWFDLPNEDVMEQPIVTWDTHGDDDKYTLVMVDPDAPKPVEGGDGSAVGTSGPWLHWYVLNARAYPGSESAYKVAPYIGPGQVGQTIRPVGTHRYIFMLFEQLRPGKLSASFVRRQWDLRGFLKENLLDQNILRPVSMNMFYGTHHEDF